MSKRNKNETVGTMREYITIERATTTENSFADKVQTWSTLWNVWAAVDYPLTKSGEEYEGVINVADRSVVFEIRGPIDVTVKDRVSYDSKYFDINTIEKDVLNGRWKLHSSSSV